MLVILADDLGYGDVGAYNPSGRIATPNLDRIAAESVRMTDAHTPASWCIPTRYGLLTGRMPIGIDLSDRGRAVIPDGLPTLPGTLRDAGYATSMVGKWHLGFSSGEPDQGGDGSELRGGPVDRGFDRYFGIPRSLDIPPYYEIRDRRMLGELAAEIDARNTAGWSPIQGEFWRAGQMTEGFRHVETTPHVLAESLSELGRLRSGEQPFFLYVALPSPHTPWVPTEEFAGRSEVPLYGDFMMQVDAAIGQIVDALGEDAADTLVLITSDNGPVWYDSDEAKYGHAAAGPYRGMKGDAWEGGHRVPLLVRWPGRIEPGESDALWSHTDLFATVCRAAGIETPDSAIDSDDFLDHWTDGADATRWQMLQLSTKRVVSYRGREWKLIPALGSGGFTKPSKRDPEPGEASVQLYDLAADPGETVNLASQNPPAVEAMERRRQELLKRYE